MRKDYHEMLLVSMKPFLLSLVVFNVTNVTYRLMSTQTEKQRESFGRLLLNLRKDLKIEQEEAAKRAGMSRQQWNRLETGASGTRQETLERIVGALGLHAGTAQFNSVYLYAGFSPPMEVPVPTAWIGPDPRDNMGAATYPSGKPTESRELHDDAREEYDRIFFSFEGEPGFSKLTPSEKDALVRKAMRPNPPKDFRQTVEEAKKETSEEE